MTNDPKATTEGGERDEHRRLFRNRWRFCAAICDDAGTDAGSGTDGLYVLLEPIRDLLSLPYCEHIF